MAATVRDLTDATIHILFIFRKDVWPRNAEAAKIEEMHWRQGKIRAAKTILWKEGRLCNHRTRLRLIKPLIHLKKTKLN